MTKSPCKKDCPRRTAVPNCHTTCKEYLKFAAEREAFRKMRGKAKSGCKR